jgi:hypothetical protein
MAIEISDKTKDDAKAFRKVLNIDTKTGLATVDSTWYEGVAKDAGLTIDDIKKVRELDTHVANVITLGGGDEALAVAKKHKDLERVQVRVHADGKNAFGFDWKRQITTMNPTTKETGTKYGVANIKFDFYGTGTHGELKVIREHLSAQGAAALAD